MPYKVLQRAQVEGFLATQGPMTEDFSQEKPDPQGCQILIFDIHMQVEYLTTLVCIK